MQGEGSKNLNQEKEDLISVIIPVYNSQNYIKQAIDSIKMQTYQNWEAIFVDDNSTDKSKEIIRKSINNTNGKMKLIELKQNSGPSTARNKGLEIANGRYITYLDADDLWKKNKLEMQYKFMKENNYAFTYSSYKYINHKGRISKSIEVQEKLDYKEALKRIRILPITTMIDTNQIKKDMLIMPDLERSEDIATWFNILKSGYTAYGLKESLALYRRNKYTLSANKLKSIKGRWHIYRKTENLSYTKSIYYFSHYIINAILRRI